MSSRGFTPPEDDPLRELLVDTDEGEPDTSEDEMASTTHPSRSTRTTPNGWNA